MSEPWAQRLSARLREEPCVLVTVIEIKGSAPRGLGSRMVVTGAGMEGSIGGGNLEFEAIAQARRWLAGTEGEAQRTERYGLGPALNQCCGGWVALLFERLEDPRADWLQALLGAGGEAVLVTRTDGGVICKWVLDGSLPAELAELEDAVSTLHESPALAAEAAGCRYLVERAGRDPLPLYLFGAGHVGKAVVQALAPLPFRVHWFDSRADQFPATLPDNTERLDGEDPLAIVRSASPEALFLVMTHSHELDEDLCEAVLRRGEFGWLGLIGSETKAQRFRHRLGARGIGEDALKRLTCPVGLAGLAGKRPATIAVAVAAQLLAEQVPMDRR